MSITIFMNYETGELSLGWRGESGWWAYMAEHDDFVHQDFGPDSQYYCRIGSFKREGGE